MSQVIKIRVEFDNETDGERVALDQTDLTLTLDGAPLVPVEVEDGYMATYELPETMDMELFEEALDQSNWCHNGFTQIEDETPTPP